ncbi:MAG: hypothetical protein Ta2A_25620 [Treponemataceae bacterium]|nr:MAG: hypothetical protein Ta2A_25620 [Treponemataceae bacterium]
MWEAGAPAESAPAVAREEELTAKYAKLRTGCYACLCLVRPSA